MNVYIRHRGAQCTVDVCGKLTFNETDEFIHIINEVIKAQPEQCVVDLFDCPFTDSAGLGLLMQANNMLENQGINFAVSSAHDQVFRMLEIANFAEIMTIKSSSETSDFHF